MVDLPLSMTLIDPGFQGHATFHPQSTRSCGGGTESTGARKQV